MSIFREYDIRGIYEKDLNQDRVFRIGYGISQILKQHHEKQIFIGYDARTHSKILFQWLSNGLQEGGIDVFCIGMVPTPVAYYCTYHDFSDQIPHLHSKSSIMITGSHNPPEYNGFKITINQKPFYGKQIQELKHSIENLKIQYKDFQKPILKVDALSFYIKELTNHFKALQSFPYPIVLDYGNGVGALAMSQILKNLNIKHDELYADPDGTFPNHHPDPSEEKNLKDLKEYMSLHQIQIALAFDGDADRIALLTSHHHFKGDELGILFAEEISKTKSHPIVIGEVKCSQIMYDKINALGQGIMYKTGHSNLKIKLKELNADLAIELSGHIFFNDRYYGYDDAIYAGLRSLELFLSHTPKSLEKKINSLPKICSTQEEKIQTTEEKKFKQIELLKTKLRATPKDFPKIIDIIDIDGVRVVFEKGWGLIRASNTTPVIVTRFEAENEELLLEYKKSLLKLLQDSQKESQ